MGQLYLSNIDFLKNGVPASIIATMVRPRCTPAFEVADFRCQGDCDGPQKLIEIVLPKVARFGVWYSRGKKDESHLLQNPRGEEQHDRHNCDDAHVAHPLLKCVLETPQRYSGEAHKAHPPLLKSKWLLCGPNGFDLELALAVRRARRLVAHEE